MVEIKLAVGTRRAGWCAVAALGVALGCAAAPEVDLDPYGIECDEVAAPCSATPPPDPPLDDPEDELVATRPAPTFSVECVADRVCASGGLIPARPRVLLVVDRSGSMTYELSPGRTRWQALTSTLSAAGGVIPAFEQDVQFGLSFYTYRGAADSSCDALSEPVWSLWAEAFAQTTPISDGQTPTAEALAQAALELQRFPPDEPRAIILATDGMPDSCTQQKVDTQGTLAEQRTVQQDVVQTVADIYSAGITTYVVGVGPATQLAHLGEVANAGVGRSPGDAGPNAPVFQAGDEGELRTAFDEYVSSLRSCFFLLDADVESAEAATLSVGGDVAVYGSDWQLNGKREVQLLGEACERVKRSGSAVEIEVPCGCE